MCLLDCQCELYLVSEKFKIYLDSTSDVKSSSSERELMSGAPSCCFRCWMMSCFSRSSSSRRMLDACRSRSGLLARRGDGLARRVSVRTHEGVTRLTHHVLTANYYTVWCQYVIVVSYNHNSGNVLLPICAMVLFPHVHILKWYHSSYWTRGDICPSISTELEDDSRSNFKTHKMPK